MKILAAAGLAFLLSAAPGFAEEPVTPEKLALVSELMSVNGATAVFDNFDKTLDLSLAQARKISPAIDDATIAELKKIGSEEFAAAKPQFLHDIADIYARHFSQDDLKALIVFYKTDAGKHLATELPSIMNDTVKLVEPFQVRFITRLKEYIAKRVAEQKKSEGK